LETLIDFRLRRVAEADRDFLFGLFVRDREQEFAHVSWSADQTRQLIRMQFDAQQRHYRSRFPVAAHDLVLVNGEAGGQLYLDRQVNQFVVVDFALMPEFRRLGLGSRIMASVQADAAAGGMRITGHVHRANPAARFWQRLGFVLAEEDDLYFKMEWH
jgi:GNAT superfamily N-acetyltransferase